MKNSRLRYLKKWGPYHRCHLKLYHLRLYDNYDRIKRSVEFIASSGLLALSRGARCLARIRTFGRQRFVVFRLLFSLSGEGDGRTHHLVQETLRLRRRSSGASGDLDQGLLSSAGDVPHHQGLQTALEDSADSPEELARLIGLCGGVYTFWGTFVVWPPLGAAWLFVVVVVAFVAAA